MSSKGNRLDRISGVLTAKERALLVLQSWKEGKDEDFAWRWNMPRDQAREFNRYIDLMNGVNQHLIPLLVVLCLEAEKLQLRIAVLATAALWHVQAANAEWFLEHECPKAKLAREAFEHVPRLSVVHLPEDLAAALPDEEPTMIDHAVAAQKELVREGLRNQMGYLLAVERAVAEVEDEFGIDPARPDTRQLVALARTKFDELRQEAERFVGPLEEVELEEEHLARTRRLIGLDP